jgi:hypothetical protein
MNHRDEIAELGREQDRLLFEHREWMARRKAQGEALMQKSDACAGLVFKSLDNALEAAAVADAEPFVEHEGFFGDARDEALVDVLGRLVADLQRQCRRETAKLHRQFASYRREWRFERTLLQDEIKLLRKRLDINDQYGGTVIDLPRGFIRRRSDAA